jgi:hypothetical protein
VIVDRGICSALHELRRSNPQSAFHDASFFGTMIRKNCHLINTGNRQVRFDLVRLAEHPDTNRAQAHVTCHSELSRAATIWWVRVSKTKYSPGVTEASCLRRRRAVSKSPTMPSKIGIPRRSLLRMSNEGKDGLLSLKPRAA